ncbi:hypothetical protein E3N88_35506 [Mikania micrantha]|uniref:Protein FAR1-RELATED SEQUENCE n=1 Tax=Mikania micrantha TaxID=192012 RepID=A0A5N6M227_9ASTR|nr:hypothetical protein E3N88_35506 [Mikania micrantha]
MWRSYSVDKGGLCLRLKLVVRMFELLNNSILLSSNSHLIPKWPSGQTVGSKKIGCPFQLIGLYNEARESWKLQVINDNHNHEPAQHLEGHPYVRRFTQEEQNMVENLTEQHMDPRNILSSIMKHNPANVSISRDVYNLQQKMKNKKKFGDTPMQVLENLLHSQRLLCPGRS